jgi:hypothetical protein
MTSLPPKEKWSLGRKVALTALPNGWKYILSSHIGSRFDRWWRPGAVTCLGWALAIYLACIAAGYPSNLDDSLLPYAVHVMQQPQSQRLYGVYLGKGLILTAAHVAGRVDPWVEIAAKTLQSYTVKRGEFKTVDLTLVRIDEQALPASIAIRRMPICDQPPWPGEKVIVAIPEGTTRSEVMSPLSLPPDVRAFNTVIKDIATTGNSGSGVFDLAQKCLLGVMSRKITETIVYKMNGASRVQHKDIAKYFVPAATIKAFIPPGLLN